MTSPPIAGWKTLVRCGRRRNTRAERQQPLAEQQRHDAADDAERRVRDQFRRVHQAIRRHVKERLVAENRALDDDGGDRRDDGRAEQRGVHVADDFLEREQHGGDGRVEGRRERAGGADRHEIPNAARRQVQPAADDGGEAGADLHRRTLASHRMAGADAEHAGDELAERHAAGNHAARQVIRRLGLRHAAAAHVGKHLRQQESR